MWCCRQEGKHLQDTQAAHLTQPWHKMECVCVCAQVWVGAASLACGDALSCWLVWCTDDLFAYSYMLHLSSLHHLLNVLLSPFVFLLVTRSLTLTSSSFLLPFNLYPCAISIHSLLIFLSVLSPPPPPFSAFHLSSLPLFPFLHSSVLYSCISACEHQMQWCPQTITRAPAAHL